MVAASGRPLDLVLTDARMPDMSGVDLARRLMEMYPNLAVILMSGHGVEDLAGFARRRPIPSPSFRSRLRQPSCGPGSGPA